MLVCLVKCFSTQPIAYLLLIKIIFAVLLVSQNEGPQWIYGLVSCVSVMKEGSQNNMETLMAAEEKWGGEEVTFELFVSGNQAVLPSFRSLCADQS